MWLLDELEKLKNSDDIAIRQREETVTFRELWQRSEALAVFLIENNQEKKPIVIYGDKEIDFVVAMHAALKSGVPYVPVDVSYPVTRLEKITVQTESKIIIDFSGREISFFGGTLIKYDRLLEIYKYNAEISSLSENWVQDDDVCYILFTSGSTGEPKGVPIRKKNLVNFAKYFKSSCEAGDDNYYVINQAPYSFDLSVMGLFIFLPMGKCLLSIDRKMSRDLNELYPYLVEHQPRVWISTPSFFEWCSFDATFDNKMLYSLEMVSFVGETLTKPLAERILKRFPDIVLINSYGPTEATCLMTTVRITDQEIKAESEMPIGRMIDGSSIVIDSEYIGENGEQIGELLIISRSVAEGYFKNETLTREKFFEKDGLMGYRTGDLVYEQDGMLYYIGRRDFQIKLHGLRIELSDIESNISQLPDITNSVVLPIKKDGTIDHLAAFVTLKSELSETPLRFAIRIKKELEKRIPNYMVPKTIKIVDTFPLNVNGKIDRKKLLEEY